jgi:hypothetical protein
METWKLAMQLISKIETRPFVYWVEEDATLCLEWTEQLVMVLIDKEGALIIHNSPPESRRFKTTENNFLESKITAGLMATTTQPVPQQDTCT